MKFLVVEKVRVGSPEDIAKLSKLGVEDMKYKVRLLKEKKIIGGGPFLDIVGDCYVLETRTVEEMGEILFNSPTNFYVDREVHPLGSFEDSLQGMEEVQRPIKPSPPSRKI